MKKALALLAALTIALSLCSCSLKPSYSGNNGTEENTGVNFESTEQKIEKDFSSQSGEIIARIEATYPLIKCEESYIVEQQINNWFKMYIREETDIIQTNLQNTEDYKDKFGIEGVTVTRIKCEEYDRTSTVVSYTITTQTGVNPDDDEGTTVGRSFSLANGKQLSFGDLYVPDAEDPEKTLRQAILDEADISYSVRGGIALSDEQHKMMNELFDENNFCLTSSDIIIPYSFDTLSKGARHGTYFCPLDIYALGDIIIPPEDYYENIVNPGAAEDI